MNSYAHNLLSLCLAGSDIRYDTKFVEGKDSAIKYGVRGICSSWEECWWIYRGDARVGWSRGAVLLI